MLVSDERCTGCFACQNACPLQCISAVMDKEGFMQPFINKKDCIDCKKCEKACPMMNKPIKFAEKSSDVYAAWSKDEKLLEISSSGGMFGVLARQIIKNEGAVFGAAYNKDLTVAHIMAESGEQLAKLHGSKYVQSSIGNAYQKAKDLLCKDKTVLFSGTPCQIAGLYQFLNKEYDNLYTCDMVCHGVPSPGVYRKYLKYVREKEGKDLVKFEMRSKRNGWLPASSPIFTFCDGSEIKLNNAYKDPYMNGFLFDLYLRKPCYTCKYAKTERESDITLADFWGIGNEIPFDHETRQGVSLVLVNSSKGEKLMEQCKNEFIYEKRTLKEAVAGNPSLLPHVNKNEFRESFFRDFDLLPFDQLTKKYLQRDFSFSFKLKKAIVEIVGLKNIRKIKQFIKRG